MQFKPMQLKLIAGAALIAATSLTACTTKPVVVDTPGPGSTVVQVPVPATPDLALTTRVKSSLQSTLGDNAAGIDVRVEEGTVYLTGTVATSTLRNQAIAAAQGTADVKAVVATGLIVK